MQLCGFEVGLNRPFILLAGPCVIESEQLTLDIAGKMKEITDKLGIPYVFKASYDKANRSSDTSFRGLGMTNGLRILEEVRRQIGVPVVTDVHTAGSCRCGGSSSDAGFPLPSDRLYCRLRKER